MRRALFVAALLPCFTNGVDAQKLDARTAGANIQGKIRPIAQDLMLLQPEHESQRAQVLEKRRKIHDIVMRNPAFSPPVGLDLTQGLLARTPLVGVSRNMVQYEVTVGFLWYNVLRGNEIVPQPVSMVGLKVNANHIALSWDESERWVEDPNRQMFFEPKQVGVMGGYPQYHTGAIVLKKTDRPIWVAVTREKVLNTLIANMKKSLSELRSDEPARARQMIEQELSCLQSALAALTPEQRTSDAYISFPPPAGCSPLVEPTARTARRLVTENPAFYDPKLPPSAIQVIVVDFSMILHPGAPWQRAVVERLRNGMDYQALAALI